MLTKPVKGAPVAVRDCPHTRTGLGGHPPRQSRRRSDRTSCNALPAALLADIAQQLGREPLYVAAGVLTAAGIAAAVGFGASQGQETSMSTPASMTGERRDAVLVFGSTGKMGRSLTQQLIAQGRSVVAAARRDTEAATETLEDIGLTSGRQPGGQILDVEGGIDITNEATLRSENLWRGVSQVAIAVGPIFGRQSDGQMGYSDNMTSERVDNEGVANIVAAAKRMLSGTSRRREEVVLKLDSKAAVSKWERIDDVIMGGKSSSSVEASEKGLVWSGELVMDGGGFCGTRIRGVGLDFSAYDGVAIRLKADGQTYKINLKTAERQDDPESTYAATFETSGDWQTVRLPFREFVPVVRAKTDPNAPPLDPSSIRQIGFRLSRFDFNNLANPNCEPGPFRLEIEGGIRGYSEPRPAVVLVSSAAVERNAAIGDDAEARKRDIPIVQLNPGGILNYKYMGETALRGSGLPYAVVRPVGLTTEQEEEEFVLEASQGDRISGKISRAEAARVVAAALRTPAAAGKTAEFRRSEATGDKGKNSSDADLERLFLAAVQDWQRPKRALPPLPAAVPPPPPPDEQRVKEILADPEVQAAAKRTQQKREESQAGKQNGAHARQDSENGAGRQTERSSQEDARSWIRDWRERTAEAEDEKLPAGKS